MLSQWLDCKAFTPSPYTKFRLMETSENCPIPLNVKEYLKKALLNARINLGLFQNLAKRLGWSNVESLLAQTVFPTLPKMKRGFFGEVLVCKILEDLSGYIIPVKKWRYAITKNQSLPGTDAIAIKMSGGSISELFFVESKLRTSSDNTVALKGYEQLKADYFKELPEMILFVLGRLEEQKNEYFPAFQAYFLDRKNKTKIESFYLGLIWDKKVWSDKVLENLETDIVINGVPELTVNKTCIENLVDCVNNHYKEVGFGESSDDE